MKDTVNATMILKVLNLDPKKGCGHSIGNQICTDCWNIGVEKIEKTQVNMKDIKQEPKLKSDKPILESKAVFGKRKFVFDMQYASECDSATGKKGMIISINSGFKFIPCGEPVDLTYNEWALLKNIGRIPKIVSVPIEETTNEGSATE